jgi:membrane carboxypeptidase/penicillin-binding protein
MFLVILGLGIFYIAKNIPNPRNLMVGQYPESSQIFDRNGKLLYEIYADKRRVTVGLNDIPDNLKKATLAIEDANFYKHNGFDIRGILRGLYRTVL